MLSTKKKIKRRTKSRFLFLSGVNKKNFLPFFLIALFVGFTACHSASQKKLPPQKDLSQIKIGMTFIDVMKLAGAPDTIIHLGIVEDTLHNQTKTDEWRYGSNQVVTIVNDTVFGVDLNSEVTRRRIQHIIDSAREAEGNNKPLIQPSQQ